MVRNLKEMVTEPAPRPDALPQGGAKVGTGSKREVFTSPNEGLFSPSGAIGTEVPSPSSWSPIRTSDAEATRESANASPAFGRLSESNERGGVGSDTRDGSHDIQVERNARGAQMLKGASAEKRGMWMVGMEIIAGILSASQYVNPILISDFESAGGYKLFVHILSSSSQLHFMNGLISVTKLLCDPFRGPDSPIADLTAGAVILEVLVALLQVDEGLEATPLPPHAMKGISSQRSSPEGGDDLNDSAVIGGGDAGTDSGNSSSIPGLPPPREKQQ